MNVGRLAHGFGLLPLMIALSACTDRHATPSEGSGTSEGASTANGETSTASASGETATTSASGETSTAESTGPGFDCILQLGPHPDADPELGRRGSVRAADRGILLGPVEARAVHAIVWSSCQRMRGEGVPVCESPDTLDYLGCITFTICKNGVNFYSDGQTPPAYYATTNDCLPYGFERCDVPGFNPDPDGDGLPPTCGAWW